MTITVGRESSGSGQFNVVGSRPIRHDALDKVTGRAKYGADIHLPGMLHGKILRSPHAHARILSIDTSKAEALPGVKAVLTSKDFPVIANRVLDFTETQGNVRLLAENVLATKKAMYKGHAIAAVAATDAHIAEEAIELIEVEYEVLKPILNVKDSLAEDAPLLHDNLTTMFRVERFGPGENTGVKSNVAGHIQLKRGDLEQGFKEADVIVERGVHDAARSSGLHRASHIHG